MNNIIKKKKKDVGLSRCHPVPTAGSEPATAQHRRLRAAPPAQFSGFHLVRGNRPNRILAESAHMGVELTAVPPSALHS